MTFFKNFEDWVNEDFAAVGVAPEGNVGGMGDAIAPNDGAQGSGDAWPALCDKPFCLANVPTKRKKKRRKKKKTIKVKRDLDKE